MKNYMYIKLFTLLLTFLALNVHAQPMHESATGTINNVFPFQTTTSNKVQWIYVPTEFTPAPPSGKITKIYFRSASTGSGVSFTNLEIKMGYTPLVNTVTGPWMTGLTTVFQAASFTLPTVTIGQWVEFTLPVPFSYNNAQNLVVEASQTSYVTGFQLGQTNTGGFKRMYANVTSATATANTGLAPFGFDIKTEDSCVTPQAGAIVASDTVLCPNLGYEYIVINNTHSYNDTDTVGYIWYWETSIDGIDWHTLANSLNKDTVTNTFTEDVWYRTNTICTYGFDTAVSNTVRIRSTPPERCYCYSQAAAGGNDSSDIGALTVYKFNLDAGGPHLLNPIAVKRRTDYTHLSPIELYIDSSYKFEVKHIMKGNFHRNARVSIFMDFNNNQKYEIPHERIFSGATGATNFVLSPAITIPDSAIEKYPTGMRIVLNEDLGPNGPSDSACGGYGSGETEDYMVLFQRAFPTSINGAAGLTNLSLYPNPATDLFTIRFSAKKEISNLDITVNNLTGQSVWSENYKNVGTTFYKEIVTDAFAKGAYFVELNVDGEKITRKLILQ